MAQGHAMDMQVRAVRNGWLPFYPQFPENPLEVAAAGGHKAMARLVAYGIGGVSHEVMGEGPIPSTRIALAKAGLTYPPIFFGAQADPYFAFPAHYRDVYDREIGKLTKKAKK